MKLIVQIPCFNEADQLPETLAHLPREIDGFDTVEWLVVDDGSQDATVAVAREHGVDHIVRLTNHRGLAAAFQAGMDASLKLGANVIVNTDADGQYRGEDIPRLIAPILAGTADLVIGDRQINSNENFTASKRGLQRLGSWVVRQASTYTLEAVIQAGKQNVSVASIPIDTNPTSRESRLFGSIGGYVRRSVLSIFRIYSQYEPLRVFWSAAALVGAVAVALFVRFLIYFAESPSEAGRGHIQSLIAGAVLFNAAMLLGALGVIGDLLAAQRTLSQRTFERVRRIELSLGIEPSHYEPDPDDPDRRLRRETLRV
jgi:glycosyltransferase involved in cell wall biosynthesis